MEGARSGIRFSGTGTSNVSADDWRIIAGWIQDEIHFALLKYSVKREDNGESNVACLIRAHKKRVAADKAKKNKKKSKRAKRHAG